MVAGMNPVCCCGEIMVRRELLDLLTSSENNSRRARLVAHAMRAGIRWFWHCDSCQQMLPASVMAAPADVRSIGRRRAAYRTATS